MSIITLSEVKEYVRDEQGGLADDFLAGCRDAAEAAINNGCKRKWVVASAASARVFTASPQSRVLRIHDCTTVTSIVENTTTLTVGTHFQLEPLNALALSGETVPYEQVRRLSTNWYFDDWRAGITVTATWGWAAIPYQIVEATKALTKEIVENRNVRLGIVAFTEAAGIGVRTNKLVREAIHDYRREEAKQGVWGGGR